MIYNHNIHGQSHLQTCYYELKHSSTWRCDITLWINSFLVNFPLSLNKTQLEDHLKVKLYKRKIWSEFCFTVSRSRGFWFCRVPSEKKNVLTQMDLLFLLQYLERPLGEFHSSSSVSNSYLSMVYTAKQIHFQHCHISPLRLLAVPFVMSHQANVHSLCWQCGITQTSGAASTNRGIKQSPKLMVYISDAKRTHLRRCKSCTRQKMW